MLLPCKDCICLAMCIAKRNHPGYMITALASDCKLIDRYIYDYIPDQPIPYYTLNDERVLIMDHYFKHRVVLK